MKPLTPRQRTIYAWLLDHLLTHHNFATTTEVARAFGGSNRSSGKHMLDALAERGWLERQGSPKAPRYRFAGVTLSADRGDGADWPDEPASAPASALDTRTPVHQDDSVGRPMEKGSPGELRIPTNP